MYRTHGYPGRIDEPPAALGTYRLHKHYREAAHDRLIALARSAPPTERSHLPMAAMRAGAWLRAWCRERIHSPQTGKQIPASSAATEY